MLNVPQYVIFWSLLFTLLGAVWYVIDRRYGSRLYRKWYDMTHETPLPAGEEKGFVYNRGSRARIAAATFVSTVQSVAVILGGNVNLLVEFIMWILEIPVTLLGFYLGPYVYRIWERRDQVFDTLDRVERRVQGQRPAPSEEVTEPAEPQQAEATARAESPDDDAAARPDSASEPESEPESEKDPRELMRSFARKRGQ